MVWRNLGRAMLYIGPSLIIFILFVFYPLVKSVRLSMHETNIVGVEKFYVGFRKYPGSDVTPFRHDTPFGADLPLHGQQPFANGGNG